MKLSEIKTILATAKSINFQLENGETIPGHFHVTEVGIITKDFIDCGGNVRSEKVANFQLWSASDYEHRLKAGKLLDIILLSEKVLGMEDLETEVEYQSGTIGKYDLGYNGRNFLLLAKRTDCLAKEACGVAQAPKKVFVNLSDSAKSCTIGGGCC
ncbi:hypothetical protein ASU31_00465 [Pedobacter ginsenosidimutans]|uniref:Uncharacterized protein n=1 Tax=Pedobacter ginsenosidimutans TaxID=687842 RepID=A0A0T5VVM5_9SPHI|nr:DUF6428 family protein [Pedobacter ginsenosidimutans]KRT17807.1 hypothetical protein ASU31_00465 [Pedobacter ginsenosidimutans]